MQNRPCPPINPVPNSYNPSSGKAYYFTPSGAQLRQLPKYEVCVQDKEKNEIFDDFPEVDKACRKMFPKMSRSGFGYLFLWFCPIHGHSYGFHLISGGEGRKDPSVHCINIVRSCPSTFIMILHVSFLSTASIGSQNFSKIPDSGMICSIS